MPTQLGEASPHLPPSPPCRRPQTSGSPRKPRGGLGHGEGAAGAEIRHNKAKQKSAPSPQPAPHASLSGPRACLSQLLARGWVEKCDREIVVWGGRTGLDPAPGGGPAPSPSRGETGLHPPACVLALFRGEGALGAGRGACLGRTSPPPSSRSCVTSVPAAPRPQFPPRPLRWGWKWGLCVQGSCRPGPASSGCCGGRSPEQGGGKECFSPADLGFLLAGTFQDADMCQK